MPDLDKALADILTIRSQIAAGTAFRGYGPAAMAATAALALLTAAAQFLWLDDATAQPLAVFGAWIVTAILSTVIIAIEMRARSRRHHLGLADTMIHQAVEQFLPSAATGVLLAVLIARFAPEALWMLPGLWQILVSLGIFASSRSLPGLHHPRWCLVLPRRLHLLILGSQTHALSPWTMGLPFAIGQPLVATILHFASGADDGED